MAYRILVVEDNASDREFLQATLAREGYSSLSAITGEEALVQIEQSPPDLVILDILLPDIDGFEVCKRIREDERLISLPVLFYTTITTIDEKLIGLESGASDFLTKSSDERELLVRIKNLLQTKERLEKKLKQSYRDEITTVFKRAYVEQRLKEECERSNRYSRDFSYAVVDVDNFNKINLSYGYAIGNNVLQKVAEFVGRQIRSSDIICRHKEDEFGLLLPETTLQQGFMMAERIRRFFVETKDFRTATSLEITVSCGVTAFQKTIKNPTELFQQADTAVTDAKHKGRNRTRAYNRDW